MINIVTIGGGNGQSSVLRHFYEYYKSGDLDNISISSIFSMSDDGRTTGVLMKEFKKSFGVDLPPPGDLRRGLYCSSDSENREEIIDIFETVLDLEGNIADYDLIQICREQIFSFQLGKKSLELNIKKEGKYSFPTELKLPIEAPISGHKVGNLVMAALYHYFDYDYKMMLNYMSEYLEVFVNILPVTVDKALIQATLTNAEVIQTQDRISNVADYGYPIKDIELMECSRNAGLNSEIITKINQADIILITAGDLYTSILTNFFWEEISSGIKESGAKVYFMLNGNNKIGETTDYSPVDFIDVFVNKTNIIPDVIIGNDTAPDLNQEQKEAFKSDISVKGGDYLLLDTENKSRILLIYSDVYFMTGDYIETGLLYKYKKEVIGDFLREIKK